MQSWHRKDQCVCWWSTLNRSSHDTIVSVTSMDARFLKKCAWEWLNPGEGPDSLFMAVPRGCPGTGWEGAAKWVTGQLDQLCHLCLSEGLLFQNAIYIHCGKIIVLFFLIASSVGLSVTVIQSSLMELGLNLKLFFELNECAAEEMRTMLIWNRPHCELSKVCVGSSPSEGAACVLFCRWR